MNKSNPSQSETSKTAAPASKRRQKINVWLLLITALVLFVVGPSIYFWHYYQNRALAGSFLVRAEELIEKNDPHAAADYLQRYLQINPQDADVRVRLAEVYDSSATDLPRKSRAIELYYQAIGMLDADKDKMKISDSRSRLGDLLLETGQYVSAEKEALNLLKEVQPLLKSKPEDAEALKLEAEGLRLQALAVYGQCQQGTWKGNEEDKPDVGKNIEVALKSNPGDQELIQSITYIYRMEPQWLPKEAQDLSAEDRNKSADDFMNDLVEAHPDDPEALLIRYEYRSRFDLPDAEKDLEHALKVGEKDDGKNKDPRVLNAKAKAEFDAALKIFQKNGLFNPKEEHLTSAAGYYQAAIDSAEVKLGEDSSKKPTQDKSKSGVRRKQAKVNWRGIQDQACLMLGHVRLYQDKTKEALEAWKTGLKKNPNSVALNSKLAEMLLDLNRPEEAARADKSKGQDGPIDVLERVLVEIASGSGRKSSAEAQEAEYRSAVSALRQHIRLLRGRWHFLRDDFQAALPILQEVSQGEKSSPQQASDVLQAYLTLGDIYARQDQMDQAAAAFENAIAVGPQTLQPYLKAAAAWEKLGRIDVAEKHLRRALELQKDSAEANMQLAQLLLRREMQNPEKQRNWAEFDQALQDLNKAKIEFDSPISWKLDLLRIQADYARRESADSTAALAEVLARLKELETKYPNVSALQESLITTYEALQAPEEADHMLAEYAKLEPKKSVFLRASLAASRRKFDSAQSILEEGIKQTPMAERASLIRQLIRLDIAQDRIKEACERLQPLLKASENGKNKPLDPETANLVLFFAGKALEQKQFQEAKRWEDELVRLEGPEGSLWRCCRIQRLLAAAADQNDPQFAEAERLLAEVRKMRPSWGQAFMLEAVAMQKRGKLEEAVDACQNAIRCGYDPLVVYEILLSSLRGMIRIAEVDRYLAEKNDLLPNSMVLSDIGISRAMERGEWKQAIDLARRTNESKIRSPRSAIKLSGLLELDNQGVEAEETLRKAIGSWPEDGSLNLELLKYYLRNGKAELAKEYLQKIETDTKMAEANRTSILAQGYELVKDPENAKKAWDTLAALSKGTTQEQLALAEQLVTRDPEAAEKAARQVLKSDPDSSRARGLLAGILVFRGGEREWNEALGLLQGKRNGPRESRLYDLLQARLYTKRGGKKNFETAREIVEKLVSDSSQSRPEELLILANIFEVEGKLEEAEAQLQTLVQLPRPTASHVVAYLDFLLQKELPQEAEALQKYKGKAELAVDKLQQLAPDSPSAVLMKARYLKKIGRQAEITALVESWAEKQKAIVPKNPKDEASFYEGMGNLYNYNFLEMYPDAERWYRRAMEKDPDRYRPLAVSLACQGKYEEALQLCEAAAAKDSSYVPTLAAVDVMLSGQPTEKDYERADTILGKAAEKFPDQPLLLANLAGLRVKQPQRMDEATALMRRVLELQPRNALAMNNLATVLIERQDTLPEGKKLIEQAIAIAGPQAGLLDLKGVCLITEGKPREAIPIFEEACAAPRTDPRYCFHWAVACQRAGDKDKAIEVLKRSRELNLDRQILTPGDKKMLVELDKALSEK